MSSALVVTQAVCDYIECARSAARARVLLRMLAGKLAARSHTGACGNECVPKVLLRIRAFMQAAPCTCAPLLLYWGNT
jgi:hypothetical protein